MATAVKGPGKSPSVDATRKPSSKPTPGTTPVVAAAAATGGGARKPSAAKPGGDVVPAAGAEGAQSIQLSPEEEAAAAATPPPKPSTPIPQHWSIPRVPWQKAPVQRPSCARPFVPFHRGMLDVAVGLRLPPQVEFEDGRWKRTMLDLKVVPKVVKLHLGPTKVTHEFHKGPVQVYLQVLDDNFLQSSQLEQNKPQWSTCNFYNPVPTFRVRGQDESDDESGSDFEDELFRQSFEPVDLLRGLRSDLDVDNRWRSGEFENSEEVAHLQQSFEPMNFLR